MQQDGWKQLDGLYYSRQQIDCWMTEKTPEKNRRAMNALICDATNKISSLMNWEGNLSSYKWLIQFDKK